MQHIKFYSFTGLTFFTMLLLILQACNNNSTVSYEDNSKKSSDSILHIDTGSTAVSPFDGGPINKFPGANEKEERQRIINMQIDSTYAAINLLDDLKEQINAETEKQLTMAERNKKSKAIFNINIIQNELTRALDASILANLQVRTKELAGITTELEKNVTHLQQVTDNLKKATQTISRLIDILAYGLTRGWIKPLTPKTAEPAQVKATAS